MNDDELLSSLHDALQPPDRLVPEDGLAAVRAQAAAAGPAGASGPSGDGGATRRTVLFGSIAAAIGAAAGIAGTVAVTTDGEGDGEEAGPPTRPVEFAAVPAGASVQGRTIDHTWGMELLLDVSGFPTDRDYAVTYATAEGTVSAGGFRSVAVPMACRFNGTVLQDAVTEIVVADQASGEVVLRGRPA
ncbi:hypothetical protein ACE2AJ_09305 [Aquihabitans daechungensis]|uniref:hypothetical protein n=1 Tax=Aquihabitans daechungensis TaxID=1052257 RepID=UPI003B9E488D